MPNPRVWNRKLHRWGSAAIALPFLLVLCTGLLLQVKKQVTWVQPPEHRGTGAPALTLPDVLARVQAVPEAGIRTWDDVDRVDVRPGKKLIKVIGHSRWEVQLDAATGAVLQTAYRRSDLIEQLHDGSFFADAAKTWVFLPVAVVVLGLWVTGIYLFLLPIRQRRLNARAATARSAPRPRPAARA
ncbi:PepSY domain-containing protein [Roseisolibacter sp. H3M3-2]|uniref:PepSY domain-containing protein n=1 Tax=Roseisolibacter sp. H3M3-2 TaxID=3031323 RepID=UPI0023DB9E69|nr:PepSY domain-containing protein [Roseisolibacter sp. H3M3-2]MDF1501644.1 PepSY domain-containing protein [Roseisolibacter sp. H3M3-2]